MRALSPLTLTPTAFTIASIFVVERLIWPPRFRFFNQFQLCPQSPLQALWAALVGARQEQAGCGEVDMVG